MDTFELYIHGTPNGHKICGPDEDSAYIKSFYLHGKEEKTYGSAMQIDIYGGDSYYTYIHQDITDIEGRPGAFFAMTLCFKRAYCTDVATLYNLFQTVYDEVCVGRLIARQRGGEKFLVPDFKSSMFDKQRTTVAVISQAFKNKIPELFKSELMPIGDVADTFQKAKRPYSLSEVDSPLFVDSFKKQSIIVSPEIEPAALTCQTIAGQLKHWTERAKALEADKSRLETENEGLTNENKKMSGQLGTLSREYEKKYSSEIDKLNNDLARATQERDKLRAKIEEAKSSIDLIDKPMQKLIRLLAGRFPDSNDKDGESTPESTRESHKKNTEKIRKPWLNSILLVIVVGLCAANLYFLIHPKSATDDTANSRPATPAYDLDNAGSDGDENPGAATAEATEETPQYDDWKDCYIDIAGFKDKLDKKRTYTLSIMKKRDQQTKANVPQGVWSVSIDSVGTINNENKFTIPDSIASDTKVYIKYTVYGDDVKTRKEIVR